MNGVPSAIVPTSITRAMCSLRSLHRRLRLAQEPRDGRLALDHLRQQDLDRDRLLQIQVARLDDAAHAADADHVVDAVLAEQDLSRRPGLAAATTAP